MRINLIFLKGIFIINYCLEIVVFKFNCFVFFYKFIVFCCMRGKNRKDDWGFM